jgi:cysteine desulfurase
VAYLDHAATTPMSRAAVAALTAEMEQVGNPSSLHAAGRRARRVVEESRETIAAALGARPGEVVFTAGGTEADNLALKGLFWSRVDAEPKRRRVLVSAVEHHAVLDTVEWLADHEGAELQLLAVDRLGRIDVAAAREAVERDPGSVALLSCMWANNEVGTVQPVAELGELCAEFDVPFHSDAVQAVGQLEVSFPAEMSALTISAHKLGGPVGIGALVVGRDAKLTPLLHGGGQERQVRSGTLATPLIAGFAAALAEASAGLDMRGKYLAGLRDELIERVGVAVPDSVLNGDPDPRPTHRLPNNAHFSFPGCEGDALLMLLDAHGVECSTGSACSAGVPQPSHVLLALGVESQQARGSLRFSLGMTSRASDVDELIAVLPGAVERAQRAGAARAGR